MSSDQQELLISFSHAPKKPSVTLQTGFGGVFRAGLVGDSARHQLLETLFPILFADLKSVPACSVPPYLDLALHGIFPIS
jgi:hypothetical protein